MYTELIHEERYYKDTPSYKTNKLKQNIYKKRCDEIYKSFEKMNM